MNKQLRKNAVLAMELLASSVSDETAIEGWLMCGVPDGDIEYGNMDTDQVDDYFLEDKHFAELMGCFMRTMKRAMDDGLFIDKVSSK